MKLKDKLILVFRTLLFIGVMFIPIGVIVAIWTTGITGFKICSTGVILAITGLGSLLIDD